MTEYFNLLESGPKGAIYILPAIIMFFIGISVIIYQNKKVKAGKLDSINLFYKIWTGGVSIWIILASITIFSEYFKMLYAIDNKQYSIVEGIVENFDPMPYEGHKVESFTVENARFEYSDYSITNCFNNTKSHGGPINQGVYVKIYHVDNHIIRLWVKK